jgi:sigma-B regulation protein RsbU (phosphoserine phosphatase)
MLTKLKNLPVESWRDADSAIVNQTLLRTVLDSLAEGVIVADSDGKFLYFNPMAEKILGIGLQEVGPEEWTAVYGCYLPDQITPYPPADLPLARAIRGQDLSDEILFIKNERRPEGIFISVTASPLKSIKPGIAGGIVIIRDISRLIDSEQALRRTESSLKKLVSAVEQTADGVIITDTQGIIEYVNPAFENLTGYSRSEVYGQTPRILRSGLQDEAFYDNLWGIILSGTPFKDTIVNKKKNGELIWCQQTITPMKDQDGLVTNFVSVIKDITELKKKHELDLQLRLARELQQRFYQQKISVAGFDIAGAAFPAVETGGDYFDFIRTHDDYIWMVVADVCGHGIGSALIMAEVRAYLHAFARIESDPGIVLGWLNHELKSHLDSRQYVTMMMVRLHPGRKIIEFAGAGHVPAYLLNHAAEVSCILYSKGIPLGLDTRETYIKSEPLPLQQGDTLILISDGIVEAHALNRSEFGFNRVLEMVRSLQQSGSRETLNGLYEAVRSFTQNQPQEDDITAIICKVDSDKKPD